MRVVARHHHLAGRHAVSVARQLHRQFSGRRQPRHQRGGESPLGVLHDRDGSGKVGGQARQQIAQHARRSGRADHPHRDDLAGAKRDRPADHRLGQGARPRHLYHAADGPYQASQADVVKSIARLVEDLQRPTGQRILLQRAGRARRVCHHQDRAGALAHDAQAGVRPAHDGHQQVHGDQIRSQLSGQAERLRPVAGLADNLYVRLAGEPFAQHRAHHLRIVDNQHADARRPTARPTAPALRLNQQRSLGACQARHATHGRGQRSGRRRVEPCIRLGEHLQGAASQGLHRERAQVATVTRHHHNAGGAVTHDPLGCFQPVHHGHDHIHGDDVGPQD